MCQHIDLQHVAAVLHDYWPDEYPRVCSALEAMVHIEPDEDEADVDVSMFEDKN